ncbi:relaxase/mobilization nuclease domain-containing protein [Planktothrix sp. FACHB-1355]|uniref:Relaxase/mobilization nuclease domain-containing protein n=1 Tax=Aerosakkonema funiforme FACHB-1375 TaxID=2949571 RepID=A0A926VDJ9_9CYAN|nr:MULTISPECIES: relaxase/mobilization nuclease domain-containing protein [Oscillatoriales]MBD2181877.1 relaxase/mobilization nuclease domain-containing protein [Aerosakkonema funiforme FACHB-1375]MBD3557297.1 relaxase/mobilization nuclease domain-containing protein [Planktothrix sp. FACHB-1355]
MIGKATKGADFRGLLRYIFSKERSQLVGGNLGQQSILGMQQEFEAISCLNHRVRYPVLHLSLSPHPDDRLSDDRAFDLIDDMVNRCGYGDCQWVAARHDDTITPVGKPRPHYHVIINRVRLTDCRVVSAWKDWQRYEIVLQELREEYKLTGVIDSRDSPRRELTTAQVLRTRQSQHSLDDSHYSNQIHSDPSVRAQLQNAIDSAITLANSVTSFSKTLSTAGVSTVVTSRGIKFEKDGMWFAGYQLGKGYTLKSLERRLSQQNLVRTIAPIIAACLVNQTRLVGKYHTAYWEDDQLVLMDNQSSTLKMRAVNKDGYWQPIGRAKLTDTDVRHFLEIDLRRRQAVREVKKQHQKEQTEVEVY